MRKRGWRVFAACRKIEDCDRMIAEGFDSPRLDYTDPASMDTALAQVLAATGGTLDALYNNGAYGLPGAVEDLPRDGLRAIFETNLFGVHDLTTRVIPVMRAQGYGRIVNCSSVLGFVTMKWRGAYVASKFALEGLTDTLRLEMADTPIKVILIEPGPITSKIRVNSIPHFEKWINWKASPRRAQYEASLIPRLYTKRAPDRFELAPSATSDALVKAVERINPAPRYYVTTPTYLMGFARRILSTRALDWLISRG